MTIKEKKREALINRLADAITELRSGKASLFSLCEKYKIVGHMKSFINLGLYKDNKFVHNNDTGRNIAIKVIEETNRMLREKYGKSKSSKKKLKQTQIGGTTDLEQKVDMIAKQVDEISKRLFMTFRSIKSIQGLILDREYGSVETLNQEES